MIQELHQRTCEQLERRADQYAKQHNKGREHVNFSPGDMVWVHLRKGRFPAKRKSKLAQRGDGPFEVVKAIGDNAYEIALPSEYGVHNTFNVADLEAYVEPETDDGEAGTLHSQVGEGDAILPSMNAKEEEDALRVTTEGPITRARAKSIADATNSIIQRVHSCQGTKESTSENAFSLRRLQQSPEIAFNIRLLSTIGGTRSI